MKFFNNKDRREFWQQLHETHSREQVDTALQTIKTDTARVLELHYYQNIPLKEISPIINRSISVVRNHHNSGIYLLEKYFGDQTTADSAVSL